MYAFLIIIALILIALLFIYIEKWIKRIITSYGIQGNSKITIISFLLTILYFVLMVKVSSFFAAILLFLLFGFFISDVLNLIKITRLNKLIKKLYEKGLLALFIMILITSFSFYNAVNIVKKEYDFSTDKKLKNGKLKIVQISDLHYPTTLNKAGLKKLTDRITKEKADIVVLTGDIFDENTNYIDMKNASKLLGSIKTKSGVYYTIGNHDNNQYAKKKNYDKKELFKTLKEFNITVLFDDNKLVNNDFYVVGRIDESLINEGRKSVGKLISNLNKDKYIILLDHQPIGLKEAKNALVDLELCGHTHNGQIFPLGIMANLLKLNDVTYGAKTIGNYNVVVSSGAGAWAYPFRSEGKAEYVVINVYEK